MAQNPRRRPLPRRGKRVSPLIKTLRVDIDGDAHIILQPQLCDPFRQCLLQGGGLFGLDQQPHPVASADAGDWRRSRAEHLRADLAQVVAATRLMGPPKLFRQIDAAALSAASNRVAAHLKTIDRADRRRGLWLGILGAIMANILILTALLIALLRWRGLV